MITVTNLLTLDCLFTLNTQLFNTTTTTTTTNGKQPNHDRRIGGRKIE